MITAFAVHEISRLDLRVEPKPWLFAEQRRSEIDAFFPEQQRARPKLWNGRVLLAHRHDISGGVFRAGFLETDFASFLAWRCWGFPDAGVSDCFGAAAVQSRDGAFLLGEMGAHTSNAGQIYFPCGTPDPADVAAGAVDLAHSVARELREETGLDMAQMAVEPRWTLVSAGPHLVLFKAAQSSLDAAALEKRVTGFLAAAREPELSGIRMVRGAADIHPAMRNFVVSFLHHRWAAKP